MLAIEGKARIAEPVAIRQQRKAPHREGIDLGKRAGSRGTKPVQRITPFRQIVKRRDRTAHVRRFIAALPTFSTGSGAGALTQLDEIQVPAAAGNAGP